MFLVSRKVNDKEERREVSPSEVDEILFCSTSLVSTHVLRVALSRGITVAFLDSRGQIWGLLLPSVVTETVRTKKAQYEAVASGLDYGKEIIRAKINNQVVHLKYWARRGVKTDYRELEGKDEATAARIYWQNLSQVVPGFRGRDVEGGDGFNSALNYSYAILYSRVMRALVLAGLDPYLGFVHKDRPGNESLVYDFSEMFKPYVDLVLAKAFKDGLEVKLKGGLMDKESRGAVAKLVVKGLEEKVKEELDHNPKSLNQAIRAHALKFASALREKREYRGFRMVV
ncbi:CRISPR-associated protein Cas1 [Metallosphaera sedula]|nr:CRISPR-associated protein Cas1 [Metallosphaera sedula]AKV77571.1 CRISPR-associated protein Cas1 [Metallosphaera sedula]AKV79816.1 CRISPR-associated protein Cas1 [Metallosphaera sedula]AKV82061.1 CRISPR-associated protein Cas1 [Metallosphaera sedula]AKV84302.1 CRISPR-associated protein Cas1 [Metallosphaera sedula]